MLKNTSNHIIMALLQCQGQNETIEQGNEVCPEQHLKGQIEKCIIEHQT